MTTKNIVIRRVQRRGYRRYRVEGDSRVEGMELPSVTTILQVLNKPALVPWANNQGRQALGQALKPHVGQVLTGERLDIALRAAKSEPWRNRDDAANLGTRTHEAIEAIINGNKSLSLDADVQGPVDSFFEWYKQAGITILRTEMMVYSPSHRYAGQLDALGQRNKRNVIVDWKTSKGIYPEMALQVAAYAQAVTEMTGAHIQEAWIVRLRKDGEVGFEGKQVIDLQAAFQGFCAAHTLWKTMRRSLLGEIQ